MATGIQWTDETWNPVSGCAKVSPGCAHCYAEDIARRFWPTQYPWTTPNPTIKNGVISVDELRHGTPRVFEDVRCHEDRLTAPRGWKKPKRVFVNSMSDLFHEDVPDAFITRVFDVMGANGRHTFQVLTKRAERMCAFVTRYYEGNPNDPYRNVWLGVSVENQHFANLRVPLLRATPAWIHFLSCEPLLGPIRLADHWLGEKSARDGTGPSLEWARPWIEWVIIGGESGREARPMDVAWVRALLAQCQEAGVAAFVKQLGAWPYENWPYPQLPPLRLIRGHGKVAPFLRLRHPQGGKPEEWPEDLRVRDYPEAA